MDQELSRRDFLYYGTAATAFGLAGSLSAAKIPSDAPILRVKVHAPDSTPITKANLKTFIVRDMAGDPLPVAIETEDGECRVALPTEPIQLCLRLPVPGFGEVNCYAANGDKGFTQPGTIEFVLDAAKTRVARVKKYLAADGKLAADDGVERLLIAAETQLLRGKGQARIAEAYSALSLALHTGERAVMLTAEHRILRLSAPRKNFLFGCATSGHDRSPAFSKLFTDAFNFGTMSWYIWGKEQPEDQQIQYSRMDQSLQWCKDHHITPKGFGYVYLTKGAMPAWLQAMPYAQFLPIYKRVVEQTMRRYDGQIPVAEIINEIHDKSNLPHIDHQKIIELTKEACLAARRGSSTVQRQINNCCLWGEYCKNRNTDGSRRWTPWMYLNECVKGGVEFERIGLQLYYPSQDLFEIDRMLNRFTAFKRPLHISEISCNSAPGLDPASMLAKDDVPGWHGTWSETMQADWMESIYTLCYSKPEFEAVGWWDFADYGGHFWPFGGLLHQDSTPKESYHRLLALKKKWGV